MCQVLILITNICCVIDWINYCIKIYNSVHRDLPLVPILNTWIQSRFFYFISVRFILVFSFLLCLHLPSGLLPSGIWPKSFMHFLYVMWIIFGEEQNIPKHLTIRISPALLISYWVQIFPQCCVLKCSECCNSLCDMLNVGENVVAQQCVVQVSLINATDHVKVRHVLV